MFSPDWPVLLGGLGQVDSDNPRALLLDSKEVWLHHGLRRGHLQREQYMCEGHQDCKWKYYLRSHGDLGGRPVTAILRNGGDIDMVGGEGREVLDGVLCGLVAHQDGDLGDPDGLGHALGINKLLVSVIRDLVVYRSKPVNIIFCC